MKFYIAGRYQRREELLGYARQLEDLSKQFGKPWQCVARWLTGEHDGKPESDCAHEDKMDIISSDYVFFITEIPYVGYNTGGRHVELGFVLGLNVAAEAIAGKHIHYFIIGPKENVFMYDACAYFEDWDDMLIQIGKEWRADAAQAAAAKGLN